MLTEHTLQGVFVPVVTPLDRRGRLDVRSFKDLVKRLVDKGVHGLVVNRTAGEAPAIEPEELELLIVTARKTMGKIPLIAAALSGSTASVVQQASRARALGADAVLVAASGGGEAARKHSITRFQALAGAAVPIIIEEGSCGRGAPLELETIRSMMGMDHVIGFNDTSGSIRHYFKLVRSLAKPVLCGEDKLFFASLCCGGKGGVLTSANLDSDQFVQVYELFRSGRIDESGQRFDQLLPLVQFLTSEPNPAPLKWLLAQRGHIRSDGLRLPTASSGQRSCT
ncbi:dihydrodipicolinate synthase family protein [Paenibacillus filicis]|uniref:Dihydrodipicolinate synthase family protein n=1 Tax=Paenibacillus filicis TaxID=669464 RepID=A0ABU9DRZ1_9BACL